MSEVALRVLKDVAVNTGVALAAVVIVLTPLFLLLCLLFVVMM